MAVAALVLNACAGMPPGSGSTGAGIGVSGSLQASARADQRGVMIDRAMAMLDQPYRYGGSAPGGFDCSGLVAYSAAGAGIHLPRTASEQRRAGVPVPRKHLAPGDLVFMRLASKELHVGIALGGTRFIHAPSHRGRVRIDSLAAAPYAAGFIDARRVVADR